MMGTRAEDRLKESPVRVDSRHMRTTSRRLSGALGLVVALTLSGGVAAVVSRSSDSRADADRSSVVAAGGAHLRGMNNLSSPDGFADDLPVPPSTATSTPPETPAPRPTTTTVVTPTTSSIPPAPVMTVPPAPPTTNVTVMPAPTPPSTLVPPPAPANATYSLSPTSGPANSTITARGTGCVAGGQPTGIELTIYDPSGRPFNGDGGSAMPDGSWTLPTSFYAAPGVYTLRARCAISNAPQAVFDYPPATFTVTS